MHDSWRWCFYFNLPVGAATLGTMIFLFHPPHSPHAHRSYVSRILSLDLIGNVILLGAAIMLFLALQYTELGFAWSSSLIIGLLAGCGATILLFLAWQWYKGDEALIPSRVIRQRSVAASCGVAFFLYSALIIHR